MITTAGVEESCRRSVADGMVVCGRPGDMERWVVGAKWRGGGGLLIGVEKEGDRGL